MANNAAVDILLGGYIFLFLLGIHIGVGFLAYMETVCSTIWEIVEMLNHEYLH